MHPTKAADVDGPQIIGRFALGDPFRQRHPCPTARSDAERVKPRTDKAIRQLRRLAQDEIPIRRKAFRPVEQLLDPCLGQGGHAGDGVVHELFVMVPVGGQGFKVKARRYPALGPQFRVGFIPAPHQPADLFFPIGQPIRIAQRGQGAGHPWNGFGDHILVFHRHQRHIHPHCGGQFARPLAGADHDLFALDRTKGRLDPRDPALVHHNPRDGRVFKDFHPRHPRAARKALGDVGRVGLPVSWQISRPHQIVDRHQRPQILRLFRGEQVHL